MKNKMFTINFSANITLKETEFGSKYKKEELLILISSEKNDLAFKVKNHLKEMYENEKGWNLEAGLKKDRIQTETYTHFSSFSPYKFIHYEVSNLYISILLEKEEKSGKEGINIFIKSMNEENKISFKEDVLGAVFHDGTVDIELNYLSRLIKSGIKTNLILFDDKEILSLPYLRIECSF